MAWGTKTQNSGNTSTKSGYQKKNYNNTKKNNNNNQNDSNNDNNSGQNDKPTFEFLTAFFDSKSGKPSASVFVKPELLDKLSNLKENDLLVITRKQDDSGFTLSVIVK